jgi:hypothetical protein
MDPLPPPIAFFLLLLFSGLVNRQEQALIDDPANQNSPDDIACDMMICARSDGPG